MVRDIGFCQDKETFPATDDNSFSGVNLLSCNYGAYGNSNSQLLDR